MQPVKVGLLGLGTVGGGTVTVLKRNADEIARRAGREIQVKIAAAKEVKLPPSELEGIQLVSDLNTVVDDPEVQIVVELLGGIEPALSTVLKAIAKGKHVVTANKHLIAKHGNEIFAAASAKGVVVAFEAAVAGGIPIIKAMREGLTANRIEWLAGIINGTCNYILTEMAEQGRDFGDVLKDAQRLGYAEADPTFDVEGIDSAHKLTILAAIAYGILLQFNKLYIEGISQVTAADLQYAAHFGYRIKLLGIARNTGHGIELRVHPTLIPQRRLIANVNGVMNAVLVKGDAVGPTLYYGAGAGAEPTASAVIADLVDVTRALTSDPENRVPHLAFQPHAIADTHILPMEDVETAYYLRLNAVDRPGVLAEITRILGDRGISIEAILQKEPPEGQTRVPIIFLTHKVREGNMNRALQEIESLQSIEGKVMRIRLETLG